MPCKKLVHSTITSASSPPGRREVDYDGYRLRTARRTTRLGYLRVPNAAHPLHLLNLLVCHDGIEAYYVWECGQEHPKGKWGLSLPELQTIILASFKEYASGMNKTSPIAVAHSVGFNAAERVRFRGV